MNIEICMMVCRFFVKKTHIVIKLTTFHAIAGIEPINRAAEAGARIWGVACNVALNNFSGTLSGFHRGRKPPGGGI